MYPLSKTDYDLLADPSGNLTEYAFMQCKFTKGKRTLQSRPHGNSKSGKAFLPTQKSRKDEIKKLSQTSRPKEVFHQIIEGKGGVKHLSFLGEHARNYQLVSDYRRSVSSHSKTSKAPDAVVELMQMCKVESRDPSTAFVRRVHSSPELQWYSALTAN